MNFEDARRIMVDSQLRPNRVTNEGVLAAMGTLPREQFVPEAQRPVAYVDEDLAIAPGRYNMEPLTLARLVQAAAPKSFELCLVVGAGTGYSAAVFARLCDTVFALESDGALAASTSALMSDLAMDNIVIVEGALVEGLPKQGPYDVIMVNGGVKIFPDALTDQLADGGRMVTVMIDEVGLGRAVLIVKGATGISQRVLFDASIPALPEFEKEAGFVF